MQRYFIPLEDWYETYVVLNEEDTHHITRVMRLKVDDYITCIHPSGQTAKCQISSLDRFVKATIVKWVDERTELPVHITIAQGLPKGDKFEVVLQKGTELGATSFIPFDSEHTIVKWNKQKQEKKKIRFEKIVKEASEQCYRTKIPTIQPFMSFDLLLKHAEEYDVILFADETQVDTESPYTLKRLFKDYELKNKHVLICIGPEGGFSEDERRTFKRYGFIPTGLGPRILRTETVALFVLSVFSYQYE